MEKLENIIASNLINLRKHAKLTQLEFGEKFDYSDKTVSKWELGTVIPSVETLKQIADFYGVTVDYILTEHKDEKIKNSVLGATINARDKIIFMGLVVAVIWCIAAAVYAAGHISQSFRFPWVMFIWAVPASLFASSYFSHRFFKNTLWSLIFFTFATWTLLASAVAHMYIFRSEVYWFLFIVGIPVQALLLLLMLKKKK